MQVGGQYKDLGFESGNQGLNDETTGKTLKRRYSGFILRLWHNRTERVST